MPAMREAVGGRVLGARAAGRPLDRLAWVHATSTFGDALVAVALAGTLFFAVPVAAARPRVALYLLLTVAPFAVVAPLLGRLLDGRSGAGRLALFAAMALRAALAALAVARTQSLLLYPLAFGLLVCSRAHGISRTAMVPELADPTTEPNGPRPGEAGGSRRGEAGGSRSGETGGSRSGEAGGPRVGETAGSRPGRQGVWPDLVAVNGRMARVAALGGTAGALLGVGLDRLLGGGAVLWAAAIAFTAGGVLALGLPTTRRPRRPRGPSTSRPEATSSRPEAASTPGVPGRVPRWGSVADQTGGRRRSSTAPGATRWTGGRRGWPGRRGGFGWRGRPTPVCGRWVGSPCSCSPSSSAGRGSGPPASGCSWPAWAWAE